MLMGQITILLADNELDYLGICSEYLEMIGFKVIPAHNASEALQLLKDWYVHLAVLDLRLNDDDDINDRSGMMVASQSSPTISKIILTKFPSLVEARKAMKSKKEAPSIAVDFIDKLEGLDALVDGINEAISSHLSLNSSLKITWKTTTPYSLIEFIEPGLKKELLLDRVGEFEDLLRRLYFDYSEVRVERLVWQRDGRSALVTHAFKESGAPDSFILVCGRQDSVARELHIYKDQAPAPGETSTTSKLCAQTTHFDACIYTLAGADLEKVRPLAEIYRSGSEKAINASLTGLFQKTLEDWSQGKRTVDAGTHSGESFRQLSGLAKENVSAAAFSRRVQAIVSQAPVLGSELRAAGDAFIFQYGHSETVFPDPTGLMFKNWGSKQPLALIKTPGWLSGENILADEAGHVWLTDFSEAGDAPPAWSHVLLEAEIRFDWIDTASLQQIFALEQVLSGGEFFKLDTTDIESGLRPAVHAIQTIRKFGGNEPLQDLAAYHQGIFMQAARRIWQFDPEKRLMPGELARLVHALAAMAFIAARWGSPEPADPAPAEAGLRMDVENGAVFVNGKRVMLRGQGLELLAFFYRRAGQLCTRKQLVEGVFKEPFKEKDESQIDRLNIAIRRLREKIERDPQDPVYLVLDPAGGYCLNLNLS
jgi:DNA-binding response OmpR family regulator